MPIIVFLGNNLLGIQLRTMPIISIIMEYLFVLFIHRPKPCCSFILIWTIIISPPFLFGIRIIYLFLINITYLDATNIYITIIYIIIRNIAVISINSIIIITSFIVNVVVDAIVVVCIIIVTYT